MSIGESSVIFSDRYVLRYPIRPHMTPPYIDFSNSTSTANTNEGFLNFPMLRSNPD